MSDPVAPYLSLVIPCYNEEENVPTLLQRVGASLEKVGRPFEVLIIDDGSSDSTPRLLADGMQTLPWLRVIRMARNGGQSAAFEAGFNAARGQVIATIDADLQNDPEEIPRLLRLLDEHKVDMITGWRKDRQDTPFRKWQSRQANRIRNWITQETVNDSASSLKIYRAEAIKGIKLFRGAHRYFPTLVKMRGGTVHETPVKHSHRFAGTAKYGFRNRAFVGIADLFGVRWMKKRYLRYEASEVHPNGSIAGATAAAAAATMAQAGPAGVAPTPIMTTTTTTTSQQGSQQP
ncbi:MAG TPA: glycosyltransferase family 2 protein [Tepidisphaeraceae bacterium]|nr:glycosyltransferase family 2 protein [Tepidisphaeraceae bacterium]